MPPHLRSFADALRAEKEAAKPEPADNAMDESGTCPSGESSEELPKLEEVLRVLDVLGTVKDTADAIRAK
eukprot:2439063-Alexandrium_andersonii.AAC.1